LVDFAIREAFCIICPQYLAFMENLIPMVSNDKIQGVIDDNLRQQHRTYQRKDFMLKYKKLKLVSKKTSGSRVTDLDNSFNSTPEDSFTKMLM